MAASSYPISTRLTPPQEDAHALDLGFQRARESAMTRRAAVDVAERGLQVAVPDGKIAPADDLVAPQHRQRVVAPLPFGHGRVGLEAIGPAPEQLEAAAVPHDRIERREQPDAVRRRLDPQPLPRRPGTNDAR